MPKLDTIVKVVAIVGTLGTLLLAILREIRERRKSEKPSSRQTSQGYNQPWHTFVFVVSVACISFFTTLLTQYLYPPYAKFAPKGFHPFLSDVAVKALWLLGISTLLLILGLPQRFLVLWGAANLRERVAQAIILGVCMIIGAIIISLRFLPHQ